VLFQEKVEFGFGSLRKNGSSAPDDWLLKRLVTHHRVSFDAVYSKMWN